jgi:hypothetical protein
VSSLFVFLGVREVSKGVAEGFSNVLSEGLASLFSLQVVILNVLEIELIDKETGGEDVVLVDVLNEGLDAGLLDELLLAVSALDGWDMSGDSCD